MIGILREIVKKRTGLLLVNRILPFTITLFIPQVPGDINVAKCWFYELPCMNSCCLLLKITPLFRSAVTCVGACLLNGAGFISVTIASRQVLSLSVLCPCPCQRQTNDDLRLDCFHKSFDNLSSSLTQSKLCIPLPHYSDMEEWV